MMLSIALMPWADAKYDFSEVWLFYLHTILLMICLGSATAVICEINKFWIWYRVLVVAIALTASALGMAHFEDYKYLLSSVIWTFMSIGLVIGPLVAASAVLSLPRDRW